jgi:hypothetical protein
MNAVTVSVENRLRREAGNNYFFNQTWDNWAADRVAGLPDKWARKLLNRRKGADNFRAGNIALREVAENLNTHVLPLNASDFDVRAKAVELSTHCFSLAHVFHDREALREAMERVCTSSGVPPPRAKNISLHGAIARMTCPLWWRRGLRASHAKAVESAAISLGFVNRARECYASDETVIRRAQQNRRNALTLERTIMQNEDGQEFTLAELAAKSTANKSIRRGELMTRIAGFEKIARDCGHDGLFLTITCPSRMHKWSSVPGIKKVFENKNYDDKISPRIAQAYLSKAWARMRAKLKREGIQVYGFRIAEPNHDGTPHWHLILFVEPVKFWSFCEVVQHHALADSPDEPGAWRHRVEFVRIDFESGSAAGYIAKYVAKNIDGMHVEKDLFGNDAMHTSARVEAWASAWRIRQFQQIGGAPVGVWRELRRIKNLPEGAPEHLVLAHRACNKSDEVGTDFGEYCQAQGGVFVGRDYKIRMATEDRRELGRYGEPLGARPIGVEAVGGEIYRDGIIPDRFRLVSCLVRSVRHVWQRVRGLGLGLRAAVFAAPWTRVNNCTPEKSPPWRPAYFFDIEPDISPGNLGCPA